MATAAVDAARANGRHTAGESVEELAAKLVIEHDWPTAEERETVRAYKLALLARNREIVHREMAAGGPSLHHDLWIRTVQDLADSLEKIIHQRNVLIELLHEREEPTDVEWFREQLQAKTDIRVVGSRVFRGDTKPELITASVAVPLPPEVDLIPRVIDAELEVGDGLRCYACGVQYVLDSVDSAQALYSVEITSAW